MINIVLGKNFTSTFIIGTRPEAIKLAPLIIKFSESKKFEVKIILTGQHAEMINQVMKLFNIKVDKNLKILDKCNSLDEISSEIIREMGILFKKNSSDIVFVQGDTTTALSGALSAFHNKIPIAHVEAGLRTNNLFTPFPEEANRRIISQIASLHFAPTKLAKENLINSGIRQNIFLTGNTVVDALSMALKINKKNFFNEFNIEENKYIIATVHRRENWGLSISNIALSFLKIIEKNKEYKMILPLHKNPLVRDPLKKILGEQKNIYLVEPIPYLDFIYLLKYSKLVITDSGGIQEEAATLGIPSIILRDSTERPEVICQGNGILVGTNPKKIIDETNNLLSNSKKYKSMSNKINDFGDGKSSELIFNETLNFLKNKN